MAKRRKKVAKRSRRRSRRLSGIGAIDVMNIAYVVAGAVGGKALNKILPDTLDKNIVAGGKIAVGVALPMLLKTGKMKSVAQGVGTGLLAEGALELLSNLGVLSGVDYGSFDMVQSQNVLGADVLANRGLDMDVNVLNGVEGWDNDADLNIINGIDDLDIING